MFDVEQWNFQFGPYGPVILFVVAAFLATERLMFIWLRRRRQANQINERLRARETADSGREAYQALLQKRGMAAAGEYQLPVVALNRLMVQSGISISTARLLLIVALGATGIAAAAYVSTADILLALMAATVGGGGLPVLVLLILRARRMKAFESQLPDAIDTMVRSLKAGHPLPVAISMVAREMPDPIGTEFGLTEDEMTYGLDLEGAVSNLSARVGQDDLAFLVVAISIQSQTGGNLGEILSNLSRMLRDRSKMRRKIHSLSAEGRFSAIALSIIPCALYGIISTINPGYYSEVSHSPILMQSVYFGLAIWAMGVFSLYRMVNFKV